MLGPRPPESLVTIYGFSFSTVCGILVRECRIISEYLALAKVFLADLLDIL